MKSDIFISSAHSMRTGSWKMWALIQIANDYPMVMLIFPFRQLHKSLSNAYIQYFASTLRRCSTSTWPWSLLGMHINRWQAVQRHLKLLAKSSAFHKLFRTKFRFNIDEWICDLLHKKCSASIRKNGAASHRVLGHYITWHEKEHLTFSYPIWASCHCGKCKKTASKWKKKWLNWIPINVKLYCSMATNFLF